MRFFFTLSPGNPVYFVHLQPISIGTSLIARVVNGLKWLTAGGPNSAAVDIPVSCTTLHLGICSEGWAGGMSMSAGGRVNHHPAQRECGRSGSPTPQLCPRQVTFHVTSSSQLPRMRLLHTTPSSDPASDASRHQSSPRHSARR